MFILITIAAAVAYTVHPLFWEAAPGTWEAFSQGLVMGLILASLVTREGREGLGRIGHTLRGKPRHP
ncbi:hypothetical protein V5S96_02585 [Corynebacterium mastitidis]|uniref:Uncharacterized protein n=1 Tax=Corynebacterium mastitidis TaxID=161890 RepID=A0ABU8NW58_9CORY